ncbi:MAG: hypothetical protein SV186_05700 [Candidatus Nanohaloarchaea archaeon]|nr:hypothetical protein [Candidatus Nanohaloarchaea archaeon]
MWPRPEDEISLEEENPRERIAALDALLTEEGYELHHEEYKVYEDRNDAEMTIYDLEPVDGDDVALLAGQSMYESDDSRVELRYMDGELTVAFWNDGPLSDRVSSLLDD